MYLIKDLRYKNILNIDKLEIKRGNLTIISGPSGSGKSTLARLLQADDYDYSGHIYYNDINIKGLDAMIIKKQVTTLLQDSVLLGKTVSEEFKIVCNLRELSYQPQKIKKMLQLVHLDIDLSHSTELLSGGQKQRLYIARTLYVDTDTFVFDEPTSALDPQTTQILMNNLSDYVSQNNKTAIIISHNHDVINNPNYNHIKLGETND